MNSWLLLSAVLLFAWLAYEAWKLSVIAAKMPYAVTVKSTGQKVADVPLHKQEKQKAWSLNYGVGNLSETVWLWGILALACAVGSMAEFFA